MKKKPTTKLDDEQFAKEFLGEKLHGLLMCMPCELWSPGDPPMFPDDPSYLPVKRKRKKATSRVPPRRPA
jgi:hypothetical protein